MLFMYIFCLDLPSDDPVRVKQLSRVLKLIDNKNVIVYVCFQNVLLEGNLGKVLFYVIIFHYFVLIEFNEPSII